jgi:hypothetical protein
MGTTRRKLIVPAELAEAALKQVIKNTLHCMATEALSGRVGSVCRLKDKEDLDKTYEARLALLDALVNPPWEDPVRSSAELAKDLRLVGEVDAALNRLVGQVAAKLETQEKPNKKAK